MSAIILPFPIFHVRIAREGPAWLVICRDHGWLHGSRADASANAYWLAKNHGVPDPGCRPVPYLGADTAEFERLQDDDAPSEEKLKATERDYAAPSTLAASIRHRSWVKSRLRREIPVQ
jgi:hypothetical protein